MHEYSLAKGIFDGAISSANTHNAKKINCVKIKIGKLMHANADQIEFCFKIISENSIASDALLDIEYLPLNVFCECGFCEELGKDKRENNIFFDVLNRKCPLCEGDLKMKNGKEFYIDSIDIER
ncbi:MAG: hydrogenase/urease maturation nickel metallochaperone HypA [Methanosarcinaceae archaeon]|jgi:hydrogenase nickel incorporation protein HypA/HybF|nr:hydrogenase/urease maturation nickel metallochaperone HypA [Methanosarcinaceae archaeon]NKQ39481.1 hydrogenase maturation nickel metallochaperone HypA [Methanosarcinales archaeon]